MSSCFKKKKSLNLKVHNFTPSSSPAAPVSVPPILSHPIYISVPSHCSITSPEHTPPSQKSTGIPIPVSCFIYAPASLQPPAELNGLCRCQGSRVRSVQLGSALLSWAASVINLLCDYCQSETPPPRRSALMGTICHRAQPAMEGGMREQRRERKRGEGRTRGQRRKTVGRGDGEEK